ncbi:MAG: CapA family protein, partial [Deltaproteobacteria bacterium]|nr:CapA family protein [Deltaproteobacteria bacterium]
MFRTVLSIALVLTACAGETDTGPEVDQLPQAEIELRDLFENTGISLAGMVVDPTGMPIAGARVAVDDRETTTDEAGTFRLDDLPRHNDLVEVDADAYRPHLVPAWLFRAVEVEEVLLQPMVLTPEDPSTVRFLFGGDVAFGRRYLDTDESTPWDQLPPDDPEALIKVSDPEPGTRDVLASLRPLFGAADYAVVNLESVVTLDPDTPHPTKDYVFFSLPGSVEALDWVGVDFISLGNNHVYDYLEPGVADTLAFIEEAGFPHTGMGTDPDEAWTPRRVDLAGTPYAFIAATSVDGFRHDIGYVATADQGGAADLTDNEQLAATVTAEADAGNVPIALWHTGIEYTYSPSDYALSGGTRESCSRTLWATSPSTNSGWRPCSACWCRSTWLATRCSAPRPFPWSSSSTAPTSRPARSRTGSCAGSPSSPRVSWCTPRTIGPRCSRPASRSPGWWRSRWRYQTPGWRW